MFSLLNNPKCRVMAMRLICCLVVHVSITMIVGQRTALRSAVAFTEPAVDAAYPRPLSGAFTFETTIETLHQLTLPIVTVNPGH